MRSRTIWLWQASGARSTSLESGRISTRWCSHDPCRCTVNALSSHRCMNAHLQDENMGRLQPNLRKGARQLQV